MQLHVNTIAPDFTLPDQDGILNSLSQFRGKWIVLFFYPKDGTPICTDEVCEYQNKIIDLEKKAKVFGISADTVESHKSFAQRYKLTYRLLADPNKKILNIYNADGFPWHKRITYLINKEGVIINIYENLDLNVKSHITDIVRFISDQK